MDAELSEALNAVLAGQTPLEDVRIEAQCRREAGLESARIHGNGVATWKRERQLRVSKERILELLERFRDADFPGMPGKYGGRSISPGDPAVIKENAPPDPAMAVERTCSVTLTVGELTKQVSQLRRGEQSAELEELARRILDAVAESAQEGVTAESLVDGIAKIARGELASETLSLILSRRPSPGSEEEGWLLHLESGVATVRPYDPSSGYGGTRRLRLGSAEMAELARLLLDHRVGRLPANLYAELYTYLSLQVLDHEKSIQARPFANMSPTEQREARSSFDAIVARFEELAHRVLE